MNFICLQYSETGLSRTSSGSAFVFRIDRYSVNTGKINKDFLHWDFISSSVYTGFRFIAGSV